MCIRDRGEVIVASKDGQIMVGDKSQENVFEKTQKEAFLDGHSVEDMKQAARDGKKMVSLLQEKSQQYYVDVYKRQSQSHASLRGYQEETGTATFLHGGRRRFLQRAQIFQGEPGNTCCILKMISFPV